MKKIIFMIFMTLSSEYFYAQEKLAGIFPLENGKVVYSQTVQADSIAKKDLYLQAQKWITETYLSEDNVIKLNDEENGELTGKCFFPVYWKTTLTMGQIVNIWQTIDILVKNGKYSYRFSDFKIQYRISESGSNITLPLENFITLKNTHELMININSTIEKTIISLRKAMKNHRI